MQNATACEKLPLSRSVTNPKKRQPTAKTRHQPAAPLALLYPPVIGEGVIEEITNASAASFKADDFIRHSQHYSALMVFAKYAGLVNDVSLLDHTTELDTENVPYEQLHNIYGLCMQRLSDWMNTSMQDISGTVPSHQGFLFDTARNEKGDVALAMEADPFPCQIPLSGDEELDQMVNSLISLMSRFSFSMTPRDLLEYNEWHVEQGESLEALKKATKSDDLRYIAQEVIKNPAAFREWTCEFMDEIEDEDSLFENLLFIDGNYEKFPQHLLKIMSVSEMLNRLCQWTANKDVRLSDPRISVIKKGLKVYNNIIKRSGRDVASYYEAFMSPEDFAEDGGDFQPVDMSMFIFYGLKFEEHLVEDLHQQRMQMGEDIGAYLNLSPLANQSLYRTLLNIAQAHGVIALLEKSIEDGNEAVRVNNRRKNVLR